MLYDNNIKYYNFLDIVNLGVKTEVVPQGTLVTTHVLNLANSISI